MTKGDAVTGIRFRRVEDPRFMCGLGHFVGDLKRDDMLYAAFVRSYHGHALIRSMSLGAARKMPGVAAAFSAEDLSEIQAPLPATMPQPGANARMPRPLESHEVRHSGEAVVVVLAASRYQAADAAEFVEVDYEPLDAVVKCDLALASDAPLVHANVEENLAGSTQRGYGDVEEAFARATVIVRERFRADRAAGAAIEPRSVLADPEASGEVVLTLWDSTQNPFGVRRSVAQALQLDPRLVRVVTPDVGGAFGPKGRLYPEEVILAAACRRLGRPVLWEATRSEDFMTTYQGRGLIAEAELAAEPDGTILALRVRLIQDCGAYLSSGFVVAQNTAQHLLGPYRIPAFHAEITGAYTNKAPLTPLRGGGREMGVFIIERLLDHLATDIDVDPCLVRERNVLSSETFPYDTRYPSWSGNTVVYDSGSYPECLERARASIGYDAVRQSQDDERRQGVYRGVAVTLFLESTGMDRESARTEVTRDGRISLTVGSPANGQGHATTMAQVCADSLGVDVDQIDYHSGDTGAIGQGTGTFGSRTAVMAGNATAKAAVALRKQLLDAAADEIEADPHDLVLSQGMVCVAGSPDRCLSLADLARLVGDDATVLSAEEVFEPERPTTFAGGAHAAIVLVDVETGSVQVERYVVVHDCGTVINPLIVEGQIHGGVAHGVGNVLGECTAYDSAGQLLNRSFQTYSMPQFGSIPMIEIEHVESPSPYNPLGVKGAGEGGTIGALATIVGAVEDALAPLDLRLNTLPLDHETLWMACRRLKETGQSELDSRVR